MLTVREGSEVSTGRRDENASLTAWRPSTAPGRTSTHTEKVSSTNSGRFTASSGGAIPDVYKTFTEFHHASFAAGALDVKTKELIALAISVIERCDGCIASHSEGAARAGATRQEAAEAIGVSLLMGGGPSTIYGPRAYAAFCEFTEN